MKRLLFSTLLALVIIIGFVIKPEIPNPQSPIPNAMRSATQFYESGQFAEAAQAYQQLVDQGIKNGALYYNLGNAYFKLGDVGQAILNYRRAARWIPRDADVQANLALALSQTKDQQTLVGGTTLNRLAKITEQWFTLDEMAITALSLWFLLALLLLAIRIHSGTRLHHLGYKRLVEGLPYAAMLTLLLVGLFGVALGSRLVEEWNSPTAIIIAKVIDVTSGPGKQYTTEFTLHGGTEVKLIEQRGDWTRLVLPSEGEQLQGWISTQAVEQITN